MATPLARLQQSRATQAHDMYLSLSNTYQAFAVNPVFVQSTVGGTVVVDICEANVAVTLLIGIWT